MTSNQSDNLSVKLPSFEEIYKEISLHETFSNKDLKAEKVHIDEISYLMTEDKLNIAINFRNEYIGLVNTLMERDKIGYNLYSNKDYYLGTWINNKRNGEGVYIFNKNPKEGRNLFEFYNGQWKDNHKNGFGVYANINDNITNDKIDSEDLDFTAFFGLFENDNYSYGILLEKQKGEFYTYYGKFDIEGRKHDTKALLYDNKLDKVLRAKFNNGNIDSAFIVDFDGEKIAKLNFVKYSQKVIVSEKFIDNNTCAKVKSEANLYRDILIDTECFSKVYHVAKDVKSAVSKLNELSVINSSKGFEEIGNILSNKIILELFSSIHRVLS